MAFPAFLINFFKISANYRCWEILAGGGISCQWSFGRVSVEGFGEFHPAGELQPEHGIPNRIFPIFSNRIFPIFSNRIFSIFSLENIGNEGENSGMGLVLFYTLVMVTRGG